jgi:hypothetical protein
MSMPRKSSYAGSCLYIPYLCKMSYYFSCLLLFPLSLFLFPLSLPLPYSSLLTFRSWSQEPVTNMLSLSERQRILNTCPCKTCTHVPAFRSHTRAAKSHEHETSLIRELVNCPSSSSFSLPLSLFHTCSSQNRTASQ